MFYEELYQAVRLRFGDVNSTQSMGDWICSNTTIKKRPFSYDGYWFQKAIADDMHPRLAVKKCSQIGLTEVQIRKFLAVLTRANSINGIFSLPNEKMFKKIYNGRLKPIIDEDPVFNPPSVNKPVRSKDQIQIRDSFGYITACTEGDATSISADFLFHDEVDLSPQEILALYQSRLQGSDMKMTQSFSTPTFANYGIDKSYQLTDQREYVMKCQHCNHYQIPRFEPKFIYVDNYKFDVEKFSDLTSQQIATMDFEGCHVRCEKCQKKLDLADPSRREWVPTYASRTTFRGYQVRPFSTSRIKPDYIFGQLAQYQDNNFVRGWYNTVLGEEYTEADARLQKEDIEACMAKGTPRVPNISPDTPCFLGIDVGFTCHLTVSYDDAEGFPHFVYFDTVPAVQLEERVKEILKIYNIVQGCIDRFPYTQQADALKETTFGVVMPIQYRGTAVLQPNFEPDTKILSHYSANNTLVFDRLQALVAQRKMTLSGYAGQKETLMTHMMDMVRNDKPGESEMAVWMKTTGNDHYFHAMAINLLARRVSDHRFSNGFNGPNLVSTFMGAGWGIDNRQESLDLYSRGTLKGMNNLTRITDG